MVDIEKLLEKLIGISSRCVTRGLMEVLSDMGVSPLDVHFIPGSSSIMGELVYKGEVILAYEEPVVERKGKELEFRVRFKGIKD